MNSYGNLFYMIYNAFSLTLSGTSAYKMEVSLGNNII